MLIHGGWGDPGDWRWVRDDLEAAGAHVILLDLPTTRPQSAGTAGFVEDVAYARAAIEAAPAPVTVMGWSYGGWVVTGAVAGIESVRRIIYLSSPPDFGHDPVGRSERDRQSYEADPGIELDDTRVWETDHFPLWRQSHDVAAAVLEGMSPALG